MDDFKPVAVSNVFHLDDENDKDVFFSRLARLDANNFRELKNFLDNYKLRKLQVSGLSSEFVIVGRDESAVFDDYVLDVWRKYYIEEEVVQIGIIQAKLPLPLEGLFVGKNTGKVYICQEADDYQEQKISCVARSLEQFVTCGPQAPLEYRSAQCILDNCYGCFDPRIKDRVVNALFWM